MEINPAASFHDRVLFVWSDLGAIFCRGASAMEVSDCDDLTSNATPAQRTLAFTSPH